MYSYENEEVSGPRRYKSKYSYKPYGSKYGRDDLKRTRGKGAPYIPRMVLADRQEPELKRNEITISAVPVYNLATIQLLNGIAQGTTAFTRVGNRISMQSVHMRYSLRQWDVSTFNNNHIWRMLIVYDRSPNGSNPAITDILASNHQLALQNMDNKDRFKILWDKTDTYGYFFSGGNSTGPCQAVGECYRKVKGDTVYSGSASLISDLRTGALWLVYLGSATLATNCPALDARLRVTFTDS